ncbi:MAG: hypothetical protein JHC28_02205 [Thermoprotei archaeon]|nr:hypothetical protein [Thermoprotei archaeon]
MSNLSRIIRGIVIGSISGILYYVLFALLIPKALPTFNIPTQIEPHIESNYLWLGLALIVILDIIGGILRLPLSIPFYLASAFLALFFMGSIISWGKITEELNLSGQHVFISVDASSLIAVIAGITVIYALLSAIDRMGNES